MLLSGACLSMWMLLRHVRASRQHAAGVVPEGVGVAQTVVEDRDTGNTVAAVNCYFMCQDGSMFKAQVPLRALLLPAGSGAALGAFPAPCLFSACNPHAQLRT